MEDSPKEERAMVRDYTILILLIGLLALGLPFIMPIGSYTIKTVIRCFHIEASCDPRIIQSSLSHYYYTGMRNVFVGMIFAIGIFLFTYKGFNHKEDKLGNWAAGFAVGIALIPTVPEGVPLIPRDFRSWSYEQILGVFHLCCALFFLFALAHFSLHYFSKDSDNKIRKTASEKGLHKFCGYTILICIALMVIVILPKLDLLDAYNPLFWLESIAVFVFGISWLINGWRLQENKAKL